MYDLILPAAAWVLGIAAFAAVYVASKDPADDNRVPPVYREEPN
jgi:hypothetical protein